MCFFIAIGQIIGAGVVALTGIAIGMTGPSVFIAYFFAAVLVLIVSAADHYRGDYTAGHRCLLHVGVAAEKRMVGLCCAVTHSIGVYFPELVWQFLWFVFKPLISGAVRQWLGHRSDRFVISGQSFWTENSL